MFKGQGKPRSPYYSAILMPPLPSQGFDQKLILIKRNALAATLSIDLGFRKGVSGEIT